MKRNLSSMKKLAMTGALVLSFAAFGAAQTNTPDNSGTSANTNTTTTNTSTSKAERREAWKDLNLTADQKAQMKTIHQNARQQMQALKADTSLSKEQKKAKMKDIREDSDSKINAMLTPDQQQKFAQMRANRQNHRKHHKHADKDNG